MTAVAAPVASQHATPPPVTTAQPRAPFAASCVAPVTPEITGAAPPVVPQRTVPFASRAHVPDVSTTLISAGHGRASLQLSSRQTSCFEALTAHVPASNARCKSLLPNGSGAGTSGGGGGLANLPALRG